MELETAIAFTDSLVFAATGQHLSDLQQALLQSSWSMQRQSYDQIAETYGYSATYLKHDVGPKLWKLLSDVLGEKVNKTSFRTAIERRFQADELAKRAESPVIFSDLPPTQAEKTTQTEPVTALNPLATSLRQDWGEAADVSAFYGRESELTQLTQWIVTDRCRLVALLGMGGMGKTSLVTKLAKQLTDSSHNSFQIVIWRSLRNGLSIQALLTELLQILSGQATYPETIDGKIGQLLHYLRTYRCLLVLDNIETILRQDTSREDSEGYSALFQQVGETVHQSCLLLTSREKPRAVAVLEGATLPVRSLQLSGLSIAAGRHLFELKGTFRGTEADWHRLIAGYSGNPLALKMISTTIQSLFAGEIGDFLQQETFVFGTIRHLIEQQFDRLSAIEKTIMYWLAINREPTAYTDLRLEIFPATAPQVLIEGLESLEYQSLIEKNGALFSLQPVVMEYVTDRLVEQVLQEIQTDLGSAFQPLAQALSQPAPQQKALYKTHALLKAQAKDYIREIQARLILKPILEQLSLQTQFTSLENTIIHLLNDLQSKPRSEMGYAAGNLLNLLFQQQSHLRNYDLSHLTIWQTDFRHVNLQNVNLTSSDLRHSTFAETLGIVFTVAFSPDGTLIATGDAEGGLRLWQVAEGKLLLNLTGHLGWVWSVAFSGDSKTLASCSSDKTIRIWDVKTGQCLQILRGHVGSIWSVALSDDGQLLASGGDEATIKLWQVGSGECLQSLAGHTGRILSVALKNQTLASGSADGTVRLWNLATGKCQQQLLSHTDRVWSVAFNPNGSMLASGSADHTIKLWDTATGTCLNTLQDHNDRIRSVVFSFDGKTLASSSDDQTVRLWNIQTGECLTTLHGHTNSIFSVTFHINGQIIASGSADQTVRFWNVNTGRCLKTVKGYTNSIFSIAFSLDGQMIASGSTDHTIRLWNLNNSECHLLQGHQGWVTSVAFHPEGDLLASASADQTVRLWSVSRQQCLKTLQGHSNWVQSVAFSPDGQLLASAGDDRIIRLWSVKTGQIHKLLQGHESWIWSVKFSPDGNWLASSSDDHTVRIWSIDGDCLHVLKGHTGQIQSLAFSPDGQLLASSSGDETVRLWSVNTGECLKTLSGHDNNVWAVAFSSDGAILASGSLDQTVRLWDVANGICMQTLSVSNQSVRASIAFRPVGTQLDFQSRDMLATDMLATSSQGGVIQLWNPATGICQQTLIPDRPYQDTNITNITGLTEAQKEALKVLGAIEE